MIDLRFGMPANFAKPLRSFGLVSKMTGLRTSTIWKLCNRYLLNGRIVLGRATSAVSEQLSEQERAFLLDLQELRNFSILKRSALFAAKFGKKITRWKIQKFYKENNVKWGKPIRLFNRAITEEARLDVLRREFK